MAPTRETLIGSYAKNVNNEARKPPRLPIETLQRSISDISLELSKEKIIDHHVILPPISEIEDAKCECCDMCEECTPEYLNRVREKYMGKVICGLCALAVNEEMEKNGGKREEALNEHMNACARFNRYGRTHPVLFQADAMREIFKRNSRAKSISPRDKISQKKVGIARSSSCIAAIMNGPKIVD